MGELVRRPGRGSGLQAESETENLKGHCFCGDQIQTLTMNQLLGQVSLPVEYLRACPRESPCL